MISYIKGKLSEVLDESIIVETGGIGFEIRVPVSVLEEMPAEGEDIKIYTYFYVREDAMQLFGFLEREDMLIFEQLLGVSGIGPKGAIAILSIMSGEDLQFAVLADDAKTIARAPGVGLKTAQKLILELKDKMKLEEAFALKAKRVARAKEQEEQGEIEQKEEKTTEKRGRKKMTDSKHTKNADGLNEENTVDSVNKKSDTKIRGKKNNSETKNEAILALNALGYTPAESLKAVRQIEEIQDMTTEQIIKEALKNLL